MRANNQSRSLRIISKMNGWDPDKIEGFGTDVKDFYKEREDPYTTDSQSLVPAVKDRSEPCPDPGVDTTPTFHTPTLREKQNHRKPNADPFPEMPGSR